MYAIDSAKTFYNRLTSCSRCSERMHKECDASLPPVFMYITIGCNVQD